MYCNFTKTQAIPLAFRVSSQPPRCFVPPYPPNPQYFVINCRSNALSSHGFIHKVPKYTHLSGPPNGSVRLYCETAPGKGEGFNEKPRNFVSGCHLKPASWHPPSMKAKGFSSLDSERAGQDGRNDANSRNSLPWLAKYGAKKAEPYEKAFRTKNIRSSWVESAENFVKNLTAGSENKEVKRNKGFRDGSRFSEDGKIVRSSWKESAEKFAKRRTIKSENGEMGRSDGRNNDFRNRRAEPKNRESRRIGRRTGGFIDTSSNSEEDKNIRSSWEELADQFANNPTIESENGEMRTSDRSYDDFRDGSGYSEGESDLETEEDFDPRWDKIKTRFDKMVDAKPNSDGPEVRKWNKQENWGRKTWKEATESTIPKIIGEGIYGVGPVLAALSSSRREFYALYVQEGLDLSNNNRKKKDKKGFEKILKISEKLGLSKRELSKHDLNMIVDNRPHQGLVLDASPLEMVRIKELDRVSDDRKLDTCHLWVALDEVTDPQNLGAIIRSAYFFGAAGVVLCAKNSAPLSGVVSKASAGSLELMEIRSCKNMMQFLVSSAENGWRVLGGSVSSRAVSIYEIASGEPTILVLGSEGLGLRPLVERSCTQLVRIPGNIPANLVRDMEGGERAGSGLGDSGEELQSFFAMESLNVSVAAGVLLHRLVRDSDNNVGQFCDAHNSTAF